MEGFLGLNLDIRLFFFVLDASVLPVAFIGALLREIRNRAWAAGEAG